MGKRLLKVVEKEVEEEKERGETEMYFSSGHHNWDAHHPPQPLTDLLEAEAEKKKRIKLENRRIIMRRVIITRLKFLTFNRGVIKWSKNLNSGL